MDFFAWNSKNTMRTQTKSWNFDKKAFENERNWGATFRSKSLCQVLYSVVLRSRDKLKVFHRPKMYTFQKTVMLFWKGTYISYKKCIKYFYLSFHGRTQQHTKDIIKNVSAPHRNFYKIRFFVFLGICFKTKSKAR